MGFWDFSNDVVVQVAQTTYPFTETLPKNRLSTLIHRAVVKQTSIATALLSNNITGNYGNIRNYYNYAASNYIYGLPATILTNEKFNVDEVKAVLDIIEGESVTVNESFYYFPALSAWGKWWLYQNDPAYDYTTNTITIGSDAWSVIGFTEETPREYIADSEIVINLRLGTVDATYTTRITEYPEYGLYYIVEYFLDSDPAVLKYWLYPPALGTYPTLDDSTDTIQAQFYPVTPIRLEGRNLNSNKLSEEYLTTRRLLSTIKLDLDDLIQATTQTLNEEGVFVDVDGIDQISDIFVLYGVNIYGQTEIEKKTLYELADLLDTYARIDKAAYEAAPVDEKPLNIFNVAMTGFTYELSYNYIERVVESGIKGSVGTYHTEFFPILGENGDIKVSLQTSGTSYTAFYIRSFKIKHTIRAFGAYYEATPIVIEKYTQNTPISISQKAAIIPLTKSIVESLVPYEADTLLPLSLHLVAYSSAADRVDWHESPEFLKILNIVLTVVSIALFIIDPSGTLSANLLNIVQFVVVKYAFEYILEKVLLSVDEDNDFLRAAILVVATVIAIALSPGKFGALPLADQLILTVNSVSQVTNVYTKVEFQFLEKEISQFEKSREEWEKELEEGYEFLNADTLISPLALIDTTNYRYEEPKDFYARTLNTAPGQMTFDQLHNYVDNTLNLEYINVLT